MCFYVWPFCFLLWLTIQDAAAIQQVAEGLREIAAQLEHNVVAQATQNLSNNVLSSTTQVSLIFWVVDNGV